MSGTIPINAAFVAVAQNTLDEMLRFLPSDVLDGRAGGYLCAADLTGVPLLIIPLGAIEEAKRLQCLRNAYEKALRLSYAIEFANHYLSRQSRNALRERWIGAIKAGKQLIFSFSGFHEDVDEIYVALLAVKCDLLAPRQALEDLNDNETFQKYKKDLSRLIRQMASRS